MYFLQLRTLTNAARSSLAHLETCSSAKVFPDPISPIRRTGEEEERRESKHWRTPTNTGMMGVLLENKKRNYKTFTKDCNYFNAGPKSVFLMFF